MFLTRLDCANTPRMRANLDEAFAALGVPPEYQFLDLAMLPAGDARIGYPTPAVLYFAAAAPVTGPNQRRPV